MEQLIFGTGRVRRFTQDSPVLPDVWLRYAGVRTDSQDDDEPADAFQPLKLLLTPLRETFSGNVRQTIVERLEAERATPAWKKLARHERPGPSRVVYNQSTVAATLRFADLVRVILPLTDWWWGTIGGKVADGDFADPEIRKYIAVAIRNPENPPAPEIPQISDRVRPDVLWLVRAVGVLAMIHRGQSGQIPEPLRRRQPDVNKLTDVHWRRIAASALDAIAGLETTALPEARIYSVSLNRRANPGVFDSALAVKADAGRRLFNIRCAKLSWAVLDTGIDATHFAFRARQDDENETFYDTFYDAGKQINHTRVKATFDFTCIEDLIDPDVTAEELPERLRKRFKSLKKLDQELKHLKTSVKKGLSVDWASIRQFIEIPMDEYEPPQHDHGTHVAGVLAADWKTSDTPKSRSELVGVCPDLNLYDFRVLDRNGAGDEFNIMCALQFIRFLNSTNDFVAVHGANLSLSIPHDVTNYACGRTPICDEAERVVQSGVVVVAAAGNQGYRKFSTPDGMSFETYSSISITDPGNADLVITVGATHRSKPHTYGVSYFSSRGPTGDGRCKPDLVAPGEKITAPLPGNGQGIKDGTSQAAPHVSGAAALMMARHSELIGRP
ncbi:MAG TPA: S8 family serine peptidase, partial [Thermoanaerobaculia bacterium]|nr:S8 family serine peptidase [Thermoanaerobaculia bacterium]